MLVTAFIKKLSGNENYKNEPDYLKCRFFDEKEKKIELNGLGETS
jgi:hypothetical protein